MFVRNGTTWTEQSFIKAPNARPYNSFGVRLALSGDGNSLAVSSYLDDNAGRGVRPPQLTQFLIQEIFNAWREHKNEAEESGAVYLFTRTGTKWTAGAYIKGDNTDAGDEFGSAVALSGDGHTLVAGAHQDDGPNNSVSDSGAAYMFTYLAVGGPGGPPLRSSGSVFFVPPWHVEANLLAPDDGVPLNLDFCVRVR